MDDTVRDFPSYAALAQTQAWAARPRPIAAEPPPSGARYEKSAVLGSGGMGKVMLARDVRLRRDIAVKELHGDREPTGEELARFWREAQIQGQLEHPSIVPVYDLDYRDDGTPFFTMRRVLGRTLAGIIDAIGRGEAVATERELLTAFATVCLAVDYAHARGVVHRDLKPANVMLGDFGEVYVLDWGLARVITDDTVERHGRLSVPGEQLGTPLYMAPEQWANPDVGPAADVFALGAILFEILTLQRLRDPKAVHVPPDARASVRAPDRAIAPELETICMRATLDDPAARYASARELQQAIARYLDGDREMEQRRALAATHAKTARSSLADHRQGDAIRAVARALALDPNPEHVAMFTAIMATPPAEAPPEVREEVRVETDQLVRTGARSTAIAVASWFLFLPPVVAIGVRRWDQLGAMIGFVVLTSALAFYASRRSSTRALQVAVISGLMLAATMLSRAFGPFVLVPTMTATFAIAFQIHPERWMRRFAVAIALATLVLPLLLEIAGVWPASYTFADGKWIIEPQLFELGRASTLAILIVAGVAMTITPCIFVGQIRAELGRAQERQRVQAWHFKRVGAELIKA